MYDDLLFNMLIEKSQNYTVLRRIKEFTFPPLETTIVIEAFNQIVKMNSIKEYIFLKEEPVCLTVHTMFKQPSTLNSLLQSIPDS